MLRESPISEGPRDPCGARHQSLLDPDQTMQVSLPISVSRHTEVPTWFEQHVLDSILHPTTRSLITRIWITEAFDHFNEGEFELREHLRQVQPGLLKEWNRRKIEVSGRGEASKTNSRKRAAEDTPGPIVKRGNNSAPVTQQSRKEIIDDRPPLRKYDAIYAIGEVESYKEVYYPYDKSLLLSFGHDDTMRGYFSLEDFVALAFFEKRPQGLSTDRVPFIWRGQDRMWKKSYSGYTNTGWVQFLEDGSIKGRFYKFGLKFKGRRQGDDWSMLDNRASLFWDRWSRWYEPDEEVEVVDDSSSSEDCDMEEWA